MSAREWLAKHPYLTRIRNCNADHHADGAGLASTVRTKKSKDAALLDVEREIIDGNKLVVALANLLQFDGVHSSSYAEIGIRFKEVGGKARINALLLNFTLNNPNTVILSPVLGEGPPAK